MLSELVQTVYLHVNQPIWSYWSCGYPIDILPDSTNSLLLHPYFILGAHRESAEA